MLSGVQAVTYTVRLVFAEPDRSMTAGARLMDVSIQDKPALKSLDVFTEAGGPMRVVTKSIPDVAIPTGTLTLHLTPIKGQTLLCGLEIIRHGLPMKPLPLARVPGRL